MFVHRSTWKVKGDLNEAAAFSKEFWDRFTPQHTVRILTSWLHPSFELVTEHEFASFAEYEEYWRWFWANPERVAWYSENRERWHGHFVSGGGTEEMWEVR